MSVFENVNCDSIITINDKERYYIMSMEKNTVFLLYEKDVDSVPLIKDMKYNITLDTDNIDDSVYTRDMFDIVMLNDTFIDMFLHEFDDNDKSDEFGHITAYIDYTDSLSEGTPIKTLQILPVFSDANDNDDLITTCNDYNEEED